MSAYAEIALALPLTQSFTYTIPETIGFPAKVGSRVLVPFHRRTVTGFIVGIQKKKKPGGYELKDILEILDEEPVFSADFLSFTKKFSEACFSSWGEMLQAALPPSYVPKSQMKMALSEKGKSAVRNDPLDPDEREILSLLEKGPYTRSFIKRRTGHKNLASVLLRLERKGLILASRDLKRTRRREESENGTDPLQLEMDFSMDEESRKASEFIGGHMGRNRFYSFYVHTSQRKREAVFFDLIRKTLKCRRTVLYLVPEIVLTATLCNRFEKKMGESVALLHSQLTAKQREREWERIKIGRAHVVVGPRSAILSPLADIGLIIVDNEHDESYVQKESPCYDARLGALLRAKLASALFVSGSSIPSVEAFYRAKKRGSLVQIKEKRAERKVEILRKESKRAIVDEKLLRQMGRKFEDEKPEPLLVFFNRRGYTAFMICPRCRYVPRCGRCDVTLRFHKKEGKLLCHYCGSSASPVTSCPECGEKMAFGRNFGIEVVEEELRKNFPGKRIVCFDSDAVRTKKEQEKILSRFARNEIDILLGTRLLAHQENLPPVSTVVVLYPETFLALPDFRAGEKTFQALIQMTRTLSEEGKPGLFIQTSHPEHHSIRFAAFDDYGSFYDREIRYRRLMNYPPFSHLAEVLLTGENLRILARESRKIYSYVKDRDDEIEFWGPALAPVARIREKYRVQVVLKAKKKRALDRALFKSLEQVKSRKTVFRYG